MMPVNWHTIIWNERMVIKQPLMTFLRRCQKENQNMKTQVVIVPVLAARQQLKFMKGAKCRLNRDVCTWF